MANEAAAVSSPVSRLPRSFPMKRRGDDNIILVDRHKVMLSELNAGFNAAELGETAAVPAFLAKPSPAAFIPPMSRRKRPALFEQLFRRNCQPIGDLG
jgi:hypothetical protein